MSDEKNGWGNKLQEALSDFDLSDRRPQLLEKDLYAILREELSETGGLPYGKHPLQDHLSYLVEAHRDLTATLRLFAQELKLSNPIEALSGK